VSQTEVKIRELKARELTEEEIKELVNEILKNPNEYSTEAKLILKLKTDFRRGGCGYVYLYSNDYKVIYFQFYFRYSSSNQYGNRVM